MTLCPALTKPIDEGRWWRLQRSADLDLDVVEGPFDGIFVENSIPLLGKVMGTKLHQTLYKNAKEITIILDGDAYENAIKLYHKLNCGKLMGKIFVSLNSITIFFTEEKTK